MNNNHEEDSSLHYHLACSITQGIGPQKFQKIKAYSHDYQRTLTTDKNTLAMIIGQKEASNLIKNLKEKNFDGMIRDYLSRDIYIVTQNSPLYPKSLLTISSPPICLFIKSYTHPEKVLKMLNSSLSIAIVGSRNHTVYGRVATENIVTLLARCGIVIVSGMATGIDSIAHSTTLKNKGITLAILGCGVDIIYPSEGRYLYEEILAAGGLVISEYPPGTNPTKGSFIGRNRVISGITNGTLIIEGGERSGSLTTAGFAAEQGRDVFALPGPITSPLSQAPLKLLKNGANIVTQAEDILEYYQIRLETSESIRQDKKDSPTILDLSSQEQLIISKLIENPMFIDEIALSAGQSVAQIMSHISVLELKGLVAKDDSGRYNLILIKKYNHEK